MEQVRFGLIGCGMIANFHAAALSEIPQAKIVACFDPKAESADAFAQRLGIKSYTSLEEMLASSQVDAVCICTPSGLHTPQALQALAAGKHVVVEKPMSLTLEDADKLIGASKAFERKVCVISQFRFQPAIQAAHQALESGALGKVVSGSLSMKYYRSEAYYQSGGWRGTWAMDGGGALMNQGIHGVDVFRYLMGPVHSIRALTKTQTRPIEVEDSAAAAIEFESGALGVLEGSTTCYPGYPRRIEICGDAGSIVLEEDSVLRWDLSIPCPVEIGGSAKNVASADPKAISTQGHLLQLQNFVRSILYGESLLLDAASGRLPLEIILGIYASSKRDRPIILENGRIL